jgi:hypothetical protein
MTEELAGLGYLIIIFIIFGIFTGGLLERRLESMRKVLCGAEKPDDIDKMD